MTTSDARLAAQVQLVAAGARRTPFGPTMAAFETGSWIAEALAVLAIARYLTLTLRTLEAHDGYRSSIAEATQRVREAADVKAGKLTDGALLVLANRLEFASGLTMAELATIAESW